VGGRCLVPCIHPRNSVFRVAEKIQQGLLGIAVAIQAAVAAAIAIPPGAPPPAAVEIGAPPPAAVHQDVVAPLVVADVPQADLQGNQFENAEEANQPPPQQFHSSGRPIRNRARAYLYVPPHQEANPRTVSVKKRVAKRGRISPNCATDDVGQAYQDDDDDDDEDDDYNENESSVSSMSTQEAEFMG